MRTIRTAFLQNERNPAQHPAVQEVLRVAAAEPCKIYLVGGYLRDACLSLSADAGSHKDFDFMVMSMSAVRLAQIFAQASNGHFVLLDESNDTARVVGAGGECFDFAGCVGGSLESDLLRRDFSINALAWDAEMPGELIDICGGLDDLENRRVRAVSEKSFIDDPLRVLRAYRFAALLDFEIESGTEVLIRKYAPAISNVAAERVSSELFLTMETPRAGKQARAMGESGLLEAIFPELSDTRRVSSNLHHHLGLFDHSVETLVQVEQSAADMPDWAKEYILAPLSGGVSRLAASKIAGLLHDIGKPDTWVITPEGKHTFIGHDKLGAEMIEPLARRMKWSKPLERLVEKLVRWHLRPGHLFQQGEPTDRARYRFYKTIDSEVPELILLALSDFRSTCGPGLKDGRREAEKNLLELLNNFSVYQSGSKKESRLLDGKELMHLLGINPGPMVGEILDELLEAQALGEVKSRSEAASFAQKLFSEKYSK